MKIAIFGLGYVGTVCASCLSKEGHTVIGVDPNTTKVDLINNGKAPIIEPEVNDIIAEAVSRGRLSATESAEKAVAETELSMICVGTPSQLNGGLDLTYIRRVSEDIGMALQRKDGFHIVVVRSTLLPGTIRNIVIPILSELSGKCVASDFGVCNNPEFLREGSAVFDFYNPPKTVIGETDTRSGDIVASLYVHTGAPLIRTDIETAEMVKYTDNVWHALKVGFANEMGNVCKALGLDSHRVMDIFCQDTKLNLSPYYLKPGFAFGGSCLPKDVRALIHRGRMLDLDLPILNSILPSNELQIQRALAMIIAIGNKRVGICGFSFKAGTDDLRDSPMVEVIERLLGKGFELKLYDHYVRLASLAGANRDYILNHIPHISRIMVESVDEIIDYADTIVIGNNASDFRNALPRIRETQVVVDLVRIVEPQRWSFKYDGICW